MGNYCSSRRPKPGTEESKPPVKLVKKNEHPADIHEKYDLGKKLGKGAFAVVKVATRKSDKKRFAIKIINKARLRLEERRQSAMHGKHPECKFVTHDEIKIMTKIKHKNCCELFEHYENPRKVYLVLEILEGGCLFDFWHEDHFSEKHASNVVKQICHGLEYLHELGIVHRDLKPENLMWNKDGVLKITDFGLSIYEDSPEQIHAKMSTVCGTEVYAAPEILNDVIENYNEECDLWSLGVILYQILCGYPPFVDSNPDMLKQKIIEGKHVYVPEHWNSISTEAKNVVESLLVVDPEKRNTVKGTLALSWVQGKVPEEKYDHKHVKRLKQGVAVRLFRAGIKSVIVICRIMKSLAGIIHKHRSFIDVLNGTTQTIMLSYCGRKKKIRNELSI